jgi:hypothetical protein
VDPDRPDFQPPPGPLRGCVAELLKPLRLFPAFMLGVLTSATICRPPVATQEILERAAWIALVALDGLSLVWMWRRPPGELYLGLTRKTWTVLASGAFAVGAWLASFD